MNMMMVAMVTMMAMVMMMMMMIATYLLVVGCQLGELTCNHTCKSLASSEFHHRLTRLPPQCCFQVQKKFECDKLLICMVTFAI